jgi:hypothetical protein
VSVAVPAVVEADKAVLDTLAYSLAVIDMVQRTGGTLTDARAEFERLWLECAFADSGAIGHG